MTVRSASEFFISREQELDVIGQPQVVSPTNGATIGTTTPTLTASEYKHLYSPSSGGVHAASEFRVSTDADMSNIVATSGILGAVESWVSDVVGVGDEYFWDARYRDTDGLWSARSLPSSMTLPSISIETPIAVSPTDLNTQVGDTVELTSSSFALVAGGVPDHIASQWQIAEDENFTGTITVDSGEDGVNLTSFNYAGLGLNLVTYYWRVRYKDAAFGWSNFSEVFSFTTVTEVVQTPTSTSPANGSIDVIEEVTLSADAYTPIGSSQTHIASQWQAGNSDFTVVYFDSGEDNVNLTSIEATGYPEGEVLVYWRVRYKGSVTGFSAWSPTKTFTSILTYTKVGKPVNATPVDGTTGVETKQTLVASAFNPIGDAQTHIASQWQVGNDANMTVVHFDSGNDVNNLTNISATGYPALLTTSYWRVRYQGSITGFGDWSNAISFSTVNVFTETSTPTNTSPSDAASDLGAETVLTSSAFAGVGSAQSHVSSKWQVSTDVGFSSIVIDSGDSAPNLTSFTTTGLLANTTYYWRVSHKGNLAGDSDWSAATSFSTLVVFSGEAVFTTAGSYTWIVPAGVTSVSVVTVGGGGSSNGSARTGGGGGGLSYENSISVASGDNIPIVVGAGGTNNGNGGTSSFSGVVSSGGGASGGDGGTTFSTPYTGGGNGGNGGGFVGGGGGAGGYTGAGGAGGTNGNVGSGSTGGGGGGGQGVQSSGGSGGGGGVGLFGGPITTTTGGNSGSTSAGGGGEGGMGGGTDGEDNHGSGVAGLGGKGGTYGGGGGYYGVQYNSVDGGGGAVRIIWGASRYFPANGA